MAMPPGPPVSMPAPVAPGRAGPPGAGSQPSPDDVMAMAEKEAEARRDALAKSAPMPKTPYSVEKIQTLIREFNETLDTLGGQDLPNVEWMPEGGGKKWEQPLPPQIFAPLMTLRMALDEIGGGEFAGKYDLQPDSIVDDASLRAATVTVAQIGKDKKLIKVMSAPMGGGEKEMETDEVEIEKKTTGPKKPAMNERDQSLMENME